MKSQTRSSDRELYTERTLQATPEQVHQAFSNPARLVQWWGPKDFRNTFHEFEFKPGGIWRFDMHGPDGKDYPNKCLFEEITPERILVRHLEPVHHFVLTMTLKPDPHGTRFTWRQAFDTPAECDRVRPFAARCNEENLDRLEAVLAAMAASDRDLVIRRTIDVPREKLYRAWTTPEVLVQWFTPRPWQTVSAELDVRSGGSSLVMMRSPEGQDFPNPGVYLEVVPNERLVMTDAYTKAWEPSRKPFLTAVITFEDLGGGRTLYTATAKHWSAGDMEKHKAMGFEEGWGKATDQLIEVASKL